MNKISNTILKITALAALSVGFGMAQSVSSLKVSIPFDFAVGKTILPSGDYTIEPEVGSPVVFIRDSRYHVKATTLSVTGNKPAKPNNSQLVFRVHSGKHYLASAWSATSGSGREFLETPAEREVEFAAGPTTYTTLVARR